MKNNNLVISDWVHQALNDSYIQLDCDTLINILNGYDDGIEPISLTKEILEANGFKVIHQCCYTFVKYNDIIILRKEDDEEYLWSIIFGEKVMFKYVHEFQHALRLCGLDDLADNLKLK